MKKQIAAALSVAITVTGCATASKDIAATSVSPIQYQAYSCEQIAGESQRIATRVSQLSGRLDQAASNDKAIAGVDSPGKAGVGYPAVSTATEATGPFDAPELDGEYADVAEAIKGQTRAYFARDAAATIAPEEVYGIVQAKDPAYQIISVRKPEDYAKGHVDGAINILWTDIADDLDKVDPSKKIIVYCYTGHTGGEATMFLNLMGYDAYNMKFGMSGWTNDAGMGGLTGFDPATVPGYPTVK
mgnify:CR=1 FL=1